MSNLYFLNSKQYMFSTFIENKTFVITCPDENKLSKLKSLLLNHKSKTNKWLNKGLYYIKNKNDKEVIYIIPNESNMLDSPAFNLQITYLNLEDEHDAEVVNQLYNLSKLNIFMMFDYEYDSEIPLLNIQGMIFEKLEKPENDYEYSITEYLNSLMKLD